MGKLANLSKEKISEKILDLILSTNPRDTVAILNSPDSLCSDGEDLNIVVNTICNLSVKSVANSSIVLRKCVRDFINDPKYNSIDIDQGVLLLVLSLKDRFFPKSYQFTVGEFKKLAKHTKMTQDFYMSHIEVFAPYYNELSSANSELNDDTIQLTHVLKSIETKSPRVKDGRIESACGRWSLHGKAYTDSDIISSPESFDWPELFREGRDIPSLTKKIDNLYALSIITSNLIAYLIDLNEEMISVRDYFNEDVISLIKSRIEAKLAIDPKMSAHFAAPLAAVCYLKDRSIVDSKQHIAEFINYMNILVHNNSHGEYLIKSLREALFNKNLLSNDEILSCIFSCRIYRDPVRLIEELHNRVSDVIIRKEV